MGAEGLIVQLLGAVLVLLALADVFLTVLHARADAGIFSPGFNRLVWLAIRAVAAATGRRRDAVLSYAGPLLLAATMAFWVGLLTVGFALIYWPAMGRQIVEITDIAETPQGFLAALYFSGSCLTTLGFGDLVPATTTFRLLAVAQSILGFSVVTLGLTYLLSIYNALIRRNALAVELDYASGGRGDAAEMIVRLSAGPDIRAVKEQFAMIGRELLHLLQAHHSFPAVHYFRRPEVSYATARSALLTLDAASLVRAAFDPDEFADFIGSSAVELFWHGGLQLVRETARDVLPQSAVAEEVRHPHVEAWRRRYATAHARFARAGIAVAPDVEAGAERYVALRREWDGYVRVFARYMGYDWATMDPLTANE